MTPDWLGSLATAFLALAFLCSAIVVVMLIARPQKMWIMDVVWPVTALYWGPAGQYFTIAPMRGLGLKDGIIAALKADTISIVAFEVGLFAWMALDAFSLFPGESIATWNHWFQMQIGMIVGFFTSYPANWFLLRKGLKAPM